MVFYVGIDDGYRASVMTGIAGSPLALSRKPRVGSEGWVEASR
jgi:hypothetical protein